MVFSKSIEMSPDPFSSFTSDFTLVFILYHCYGFHSVPVGMAGKFHIDHLTGTNHPLVPPRPKLQFISVHSVPVIPACFSEFRPEH